MTDNMKLWNAVHEVPKQYAQCVENRKWPYYSDEIETLQVSDYDLRELEEA